MRSSRQEATGSAGVSATCSLFEQIGWAPARNEAHDRSQRNRARRSVVRRRLSAV